MFFLDGGSQIHRRTWWRSRWRSRWRFGWRAWLRIAALLAAGVLALSTLGDAGKGKLVYFMAIENAKFRSPVEPGCMLELKVTFVQNRGRISKFAGRAEIAGKLVAEANFTAMIADPPG